MRWLDKGVSLFDVLSRGHALAGSGSSGVSSRRLRARVSNRRARRAVVIEGTGDILGKELPHRAAPRGDPRPRSVEPTPRPAATRASSRPSFTPGCCWRAAQCAANEALRVRARRPRLRLRRRPPPPPDRSTPASSASIGIGIGIRIEPASVPSRSTRARALPVPVPVRASPADRRARARARAGETSACGASHSIASPFRPATS